MSSVKEMALLLASKGRSVIPVGKDKKPLTYWQDNQKKIANRHQIALWFDQYPQANLAMVTGKISDVVVIDCDSEDANRRFLGAYPDAQFTTIVKTPRGFHYYFKYPGEEIRNDAGRKLGEGIDIRGDGGYVLVPPSANDAGVNYRFINSMSPVALPDSLKTLLVEPPDHQSGCDVDGDAGRSGGRDTVYFGNGQRNSALTRLAGALRRQGATYETILEALFSANLNQCDPPLHDREVETIARSVARYEPIRPGGVSEQRISPPITGELHTTLSAGSRNPGLAPIRHHDIVTRRLDQVERKEISWLWHKRIPIGRITLIEGDGGVCKSWLTMAIASFVTNGSFFPGTSYRTPTGRVLIMSAEDSIEETIVARLQDQGADLSKVSAVEMIRDESGERMLTLKEIERIALLVEELQPKLLIIDPVIAFLGGNDMNHAGAIRSLLAPLHQLAEKHSVAVILVRHLNKSTEQSAKYRGQGSIDFYSAARSVFQVIPDSVDRDKRHMVHIKSNSAPMQPTLEFSVVDNRIEFGRENWDTAESLYKKLADASAKGAKEDVEPRDNPPDDGPSPVVHATLSMFPGAKVVEQ